ncbi:MAG: prepilin peptidase [Candidatus Marinimicrobia bacterium]|nr:prepilin peptidase [Candidatus Neomarinimicrobiota bacterium]MBL7046660.1 prepilin peptidase [Candidatus Neomarinimicrobiota bacterium]
MILVLIISGLMIGSFLNVCIYRIPRGESIISPRSRCPQCKHQLKAWENIPVFSYIFLKGRCSACHSRISLRYPVVELITALVFVIVYSQFGLSLNFLAFVSFLCIVIVITFIDIDHQVIPNRLLLFGLIPGVYPLIRDGFQYPQLYLFGAFGLGLVFLLIRLVGNLIFKKESMGMGDVKYAALIGLILGWQGGLVASAVAFLSASILFLLFMSFGKVSFGQRIPFGPFLSLGTLLALIWGPSIINWYLQLVF